jgi:hypothetical protein
MDTSMISRPGGGRSARDEEADILFTFREWLKTQEGRRPLRPEAEGSLDDDSVARAFHLSPGIAAAEPPVDLKRLPATNKRSFASRLARAIVNCLIIFALVGAAVAWLQNVDDPTKAEIQAQVAKTWDVASGWLLSALHIDTRPSSGVASTPTPDNSNETSTQASLQDSPAGPVAQPMPEPARGVPAAQPALAPTQAGAVAQPVPVASDVSVELQQKFDALQDNIADIRRIVERIASRQEQMTQDMMTLQTTQQLLAQKLSTPPQGAAPPRAPGTKKMAYPEAAPAPRRVSNPTPRLGASTHID